MAIHKIKFFAGRGSRYLAEKIVASYGTKLGESEVLNFSDGEFQPCFLESIRGCTVFVIQSTFPPTDNLMELLMMIDAAKRASAHQVIAVMPYFGWARQDRKDRPRVPIGAKLVANLITRAGADRVLKKPEHFAQFQGAEVEVRLYRARDGRKDFIGLLQSWQDGDVTLEVGGAPMVFTKQEVAQVRLYPRF